MKLNPRTKDLTGITFHSWKVTDFAGYKNRNAFWWCKCTCGKIKIVKAQCLLNGSSTQCKNCVGRKIIKNELPQFYWKNLIYNAAKRKIEILISKQECYNVLVKQNFKCALSGKELKFANCVSEHYRGNTTASLDRIDSTLPYKLENIQWIHKDINFMKHDFDQKYFINICKLVANHGDTRS